MSDEFRVNSHVPAYGTRVTFLPMFGTRVTFQAMYGTRVTFRPGD